VKFNIKGYRWIAELTLILIVLFAVRFWIQRDVVSGTAPNISAFTLGGEYFDLYQSKSRPIMIHFWATWCSVCKLEQSNIENIAKDYPVITIAMQSGNNHELNQFMLTEKLSFAVINDVSDGLSHDYNIKGVPVSFIINKENRIEFVEVGYTTELGLRMRLWWAGL
jgi:thiol-disulfide isomerase/thioredoxin